MIRRPPRSTRTDTLFPYTTRFRSEYGTTSAFSADRWRIFNPPGRYPAEGANAEGKTCDRRSEEHTSELQSLMRISYAVFCLKHKNIIHTDPPSTLEYQS